MPQVIRTADGKTIVIHNAATAPPPTSGAVFRAVTPQGAIINLPASLVSGAAQQQQPQTIKIVQVCLGVVIAFSWRYLKSEQLPLNEKSCLSYLSLLFYQ